MVIGGIYTQLRHLEDEKLGAAFMREFGNRTTSDIDLLTTEPQKMRKELTDYDEDGRLEADVVGPDLIDHTQEIVGEGYQAHITAFREEEQPLEAQVQLPSDTHGFYTKIHTPSAASQEGTNQDAVLMAKSPKYSIEASKITAMTRGEPEARKYAASLL
ncbi:MAG: hypothetical protein ABEJ03_05340 [Candidatus Nanohaloarchaea archaeon]